MCSLNGLVSLGVKNKLLRVEKLGKNWLFGG